TRSRWASSEAARALALFRALLWQPEILARDVVELLAILFERGPQPVVIDHADLLLQPLRPANRADVARDLIAERWWQGAARTLARLATADAGDRLSHAVVRSDVVARSGTRRERSPLSHRWHRTYGCPPSAHRYPPRQPAHRRPPPRRPFR